MSRFPARAGVIAASVIAACLLAVLSIAAFSGPTPVSPAAAARIVAGQGGTTPGMACNILTDCDACTSKNNNPLCPPYCWGYGTLSKAIWVCGPVDATEPGCTWWIQNCGTQMFCSDAFCAICFDGSPFTHVRLRCA